jgi:hypothetical protein
MSLDLVDYKIKARTAVKQFWSEWKKSSAKKPMVGGMDGFIDLVADIVHANGLTRANLLQQGQPVTLPGYFSPTQSWDLVVVNEGRLIAAIKFDSQVGPSFGKNADSCCEQAISLAVDFRAVFRGGTFGVYSKPFVGYLVLLEDSPASRASVKDVSPNFPLVPEYRNASYAKRYDILCEKLIMEGLYTAASVILSPRTASKSGDYSEMSELTGLKSFVAGLAAYIAAEAT